MLGATACLPEKVGKKFHFKDWAGKAKVSKLHLVECVSI
jgi:hypothetical protein